jgi:hypothetical protein
MFANNNRPERAKALMMNASALSGRHYLRAFYPGRCPGLIAFGLSGRSAEFKQAWLCPHLITTLRPLTI